MMAFSLRSIVTALGLLALALVPVVADILDYPFALDLAMRLMCLGMAAVSLNLILGYGGMISFGHAAYIGIGAYAVGISAYYEIYSGFMQIPIAVIAAALFAFLTGIVCLRTKGVYFIMITLAFAQMLFFVIVSIEEYGGDDGLVIDTKSVFVGLLDLEKVTSLYYFIFLSLVGVIYLVKRIVASRFGRVIEGARQNEVRMQAIGYDTFRYRLICYVLSGAICGYAGALLGNFTGFISPEMMGWTRSGELMFMVILGGTGSLFGPVLGAGAFILLEEILSGWTIHWKLIFGIMLVVCVLYARRGIDGFLGGRDRDG